MTSRVPSLYEWLGGLPVLNRLTERFYERVRDDTTLAPIFAEMSAEHPQHVAAFLAEVLGGPTINSQPDVVADADSPMPRWGWGEVKGPYRPEDSGS